jgi:serine phosphatase RsbU (regulator of sigma subunit)
VAAARGPIVLDDASTAERLDPLILDVASIAGVPLFVRAALVGVLQVGSRAHRRFTRAEVELLELAGERIAVAIDRSQAFEAQRAMARTLQAALLPPSLPVIPGVSLSARYIAAGEGTDVGGDFYDVFGLGDCAWLAIVGDVCGRGPEAAAMTGLARHTVRAVAQESGSPAAILDRLNITLGAQGGDERFCTAVCARLEPKTDGMRVVLASGGHCRPLLLHNDGRTEPLVVRGTMLGPFPDIEFEEIEVDLAAGDSLVLYTDGVVEAQGDDGLFGETRLGHLLAEGAGRSSGELAALIEEAVRRYSGGVQNDDLAVVVLQVARVPSALGGAPGADAPAGAHRLPPLEGVAVVGELDLTVAVPGGEIAGPAGLQPGEAGHHDPADEEEAAHDETADGQDAAAGDDRKLVGHVARLPHPGPGEPGQEAAESDDGDARGLDPPVPSQFG